MISRVAGALDAVGAEWVLWLLGVLSVASIAVIVERWVFFRGRRLDADRLSLEVDALIGRGDLRGRALIEARGRSREALEDVYRAGVEAERLRYERSIGFLATLGSNAPFVGLLGTVIGIMAAFGDLGAAAAGAGRAQVIMGSISEALVATAVGLLVAIPAVVAYNGFQRRIDRAVGSTEVLARRVMSRFAHSEVG